MPLTLKIRIGFDSIAKLERAATRRYAEAFALLDDEPYGAIHLLGYTIEMRLKAASYRLAGIPSAWNILAPVAPNLTAPRKLAERQIASIRGAEARPPVGHDLIGWALLVVESRRATGLPAMPAQAGFLSHIQNAALCWTESLRYHSNKPYNEEVQAVSEAARWMKRNYTRLWS